MWHFLVPNYYCCPLLPIYKPCLCSFIIVLTIIDCVNIWSDIPVNILHAITLFINISKCWQWTHWGVVGWSGIDCLAHTQIHTQTHRNTQSQWLEEEIRVLWQSLHSGGVPHYFSAWDFVTVKDPSVATQVYQCQQQGSATHPYIWIKQSQSLQPVLLTF